MIQATQRDAVADQGLAHQALVNQVRDYWNERIHDLEVTTSPVGSPQFFQELADYRFEKLHYLPRLVNFDGFPQKRLLEIGCGVGTDLVRFARGGAQVTGIDLSWRAIELAQQNFAQAGLPATLQVMDGERLQFADNSFAVVYAHGVLQYTADAGQMIREIFRVLQPGGRAILMVYNRYSWLMFLSKVAGVRLEHDDAPVFRLFSRSQFRQLLAPFTGVEIIPERFPVRSRLQQGTTAAFFNHAFVPLFNVLPAALVRPTGWHLMAFASKV